MGLHADVRRVLSSYESTDAQQVALRTDFLDYVDAHDDATSRTCRPAHVTGSALVVDPSAGTVLLTMHPKIGRWLQLGGHCEPGDPSLAAVAEREAVEESGVAGLRVRGGPVRLDRHEVRCHADGSVGVHLDVQYVVPASMTSELVPSAESPQLRWFPLDALPDTDDSVRLLVQAAGLGPLR